ncbi:hypothetical protein JQT66_14030 [Sulfitobacter mediterraneus]|uniref:hypothetical protein n=1 Tax=Sulfitobacter mediterraneus TaxID=83219 RepID=UPI0019333C0F|nr:hypothetical protein [Sulfitobacter mediterraneus]MBM1311359.1 hypothetical protein [Sulfitobacter mediterraneus]MBM1315241.1 hypothetical protein [Sulfitobacter mediterraneus]MBM1323602.1 hypothetical protein [Sulfitobacter mediterraneus]MBM1327514.1 hypothetical protein [Sulfitobacter mediterraneus]MBM1398862.1 hypothetical protein [Sulfitobacter mediterraneus]
MTHKHMLAALLPFAFTTPQAIAQEGPLGWEGEIEVGVESVLSSDAPGNELSDAFLNVEISGSYAFSDRVFVFGTLAAESVLDPTEDRAFEDIGIYVKELGLSFALTESASIALGKITPTFGRTWDDSAGYFGSSLAEDYELTEQVGIVADVEVAPGGTLSFGVFYADDTSLSRSIGTDRGRNTIAVGGAGNTGKLNNGTLSWTQEFGESTSIQIAARHLSAGVGDVADETGLTASVAQKFNDSFSMFAEFARFNNFGGGAEDATYATLNGAYYTGQWVFSGTVARGDLNAGGTTDLVSVSAEYEFNNGFVAGAGLALVDDNGTSDTTLGVNFVIPLGG